MLAFLSRISIIAAVQASLFDGISFLWSSAFLDSRSMALMLVDTPGPNNSQNQAHKNTTYQAIRDDSNTSGSFVPMSAFQYLYPSDTSGYSAL